MLKTIPTEQLRPGMFLHQLSGSWIKHPFWRSRFLLRDAADIARIVEAGIEAVVIDLTRGLDVAPPADPDMAAAAPATAPAPEAAPETAASPPLPPPHPALAQAGPDYQPDLALSRRALSAVVTVFDALRLGQAVDTETCLPVVEDIIDSVSRKPGSLASIARLKTVDDYSYLHAVAVCALMVGLARQMGMTPEQVREAGLAGLLLDSGKAALPAALLTKTERINDAERTLLHSHARRGHDMLLADGGFSAAVLDACLHHHERSDGSGYPDRLKGESIGLLARMAAICDVYDAVTSRRPYRAPWDPGDAMRQIAQAKGQFDPVVFQHFVKAVGIYPVGSLVRLQSERLAVVVARGSGSLLTPRVRVFYSAEERHRVAPFEIDLADPACGDRITGVEPPDSWRFPDLDALWLKP